MKDFNFQNELINYIEQDNYNSVAMIDIKKIIQEFAEKYNFIQQKDIDYVEKSIFNRQDYLPLDNKTYISIHKTNIELAIEFGKIIIQIDTIDEEEWYCIDKNVFFYINILDFYNEESLIEVMVEKCKQYNLL